jgi:alpha-beta hydrolase superfamily lysophospholipase
VRERTVTIGPGELAGVLAEPDPGVRLAGVPAIVLSNVGMHSRIGPFRVWVGLSRRLARLGWTVLRFDHSGFGDSGVRSGALNDVARAAQEQREAIDFLAARGLADAVLVGFCSGVDGVHVASVSDPRVVGVVHLDGYAYPSPSFWLRRWSIRLLRTRTWRRALWRRRQRLLTLLGRLKGPAAKPPVFDRTYPPAPQVARDFRALAERGTRLLMVWTGGRESEFNHADQFFEMLGAPDLRGRVEVEYWERFDHVFSVVADREALFERLETWLTRAFPPAAGGTRE